MFEFIKKVLVRVSFDRELFFKELVKGLKKLTQVEQFALYEWCKKTYGDLYPDEITKAFAF